MFQYAAGRALSLRLNRELTLDVSAFDNYSLHQGFELSRVFAMSQDFASDQDLRSVLGWQRSALLRSVLARRPLAALKSQRFVTEPHFHYWADFDKLDDNVYLSGYWQSEKYFNSVLSQIREDFSFRLQLKGENMALADRLRETQAISLHVRRGDYASNPQNTSTHGLCSLDYYSAAIARIACYIEKPEFFIFSDDIDWVKANLLLNYPHHFVANNQGSASHIDMRLMSLCRHHVIANSSFSWWGAWLNSSADKLVIAPRQWFTGSADVSDLFPNNWVLL